MTKPTTEAGKRLLAGLDGRPGYVSRADVAAIEEEAREQGYDLAIAGAPAPTEVAAVNAVLDQPADLHHECTEPDHGICGEPCGHCVCGSSWPCRTALAIEKERP